MLCHLQRALPVSVKVTLGILYWLQAVGWLLPHLPSWLPFLFALPSHSDTQAVFLLG